MSIVPRSECRVQNREDNPTSAPALIGMKYDVILFGATGFTGRQTVDYFTRHAPQGLEWAIAGRSRARLEALRAPVEAIVAYSGDQASIDAMVSRARVVVSTAGPFARYGTPVVDACVRYHTHYTDITGETAWVHELVSRYHDQAAANRVRIVPCCGFDSIPSDLGAYLLARHRQAAMVRGYFQFGGGGLNGGTIASVANLVESGGARNVASRGDFPLPHFDELIGTWVGPFFMAPTNRWVVRRSATLFAAWGEPYPEGFTYREFLKYSPPLAAPKAIAGSTAIALAGAVMSVPPLFRAARTLLPKPGEGPSEAKMDEGWFSSDFVGRTIAGERVRAIVKSRGDAGNRSTVKMLCESALCLALGETTDHGGILTPATAFGDRLVSRLRAANMTIGEV
jgi:short subunit dehydrogenase-like uncharacterized protein